MNQKRLDSDIFNTINYSNINRRILPITEKERNFGQNYIIESYPNSTLNKSLIINNELNSPNDNYYENYTNITNFTQHNPNTLDCNSFCPQIFYGNRISPKNKYLYADGNIIYNYIPAIDPNCDNDRFYKKVNNIKNIDSIDSRQNEDNRKANKQKVKADKYQSEINLNISNLETQYPVTIFNTESSYKRKNFIRNMMNSKNYDDSHSLSFKKNKNKRNMNISQISSKKNNKSQDQNSYDSHIYHKKNKSHLYSSINALKGKYNKVHINNKNDGINFNNYNSHINKSPKKKDKDSSYDKSKYTTSNYNKCSKCDIINRIQRSRSKDKSKNYKKNQIDNSQLIKSIKILEDIFASSIENNFYYFIKSLKFKIKKKDLLLKRYSRKPTRNDYNTTINASPQKNVSFNNTNNNNLDNNKSVHIPKKNMLQGHKPKSLTINNDNASSSIKIKKFNRFKNSRNRNENFFSNLSEEEKIKTNHDCSDYLIKKINNFTKKNKNGNKNSLNKTQDNSNFYRRYNNSNDKQKYNTSVNNTLINNSKVYYKPKVKRNLKETINKNKKFVNKSILNKDSLPSLIKDSLIKNNENRNNNISPYNNQNILIKNDSFISPNKCNKNHYSNIANISQEIIDNASLNSYKANYSKRDGFSDNSIENEDTNVDKIKEIKKEESYYKNLSIVVKYIISPKTKQKFLEMKYQRVKNMEEKGDNEELKIKCTDSFQLISFYSKINPHFINSEYSNYRKMEMKEVKEISEENDSIIEEENKINILINILDKCINKNNLNLKKYSIEQLIKLYSKINRETLKERKIFKNIKNNFQSLDLSYLSDSDYIFSFRKMDKNTKDKRNENHINNYYKTGENWKSNLLFGMTEKERNVQNEEENYFSGNISMLEEKNLNLHKKIDIYNKKINSFKNDIKDKEPDDNKEEFALRKENKLKLILLGKIHGFKNNIRTKRYYFEILKNGKSISDKCNFILNNKRINEDGNLICIKQNIKNFRFHLIKYILEKSDKQNDEKEDNKDEDKEEDEK